MKLKDKKELNLKSVKELRKLIAESKDILVGLKLENIQHKLKNTRSVFLKRRDIAQMSTVLRMKELVEVQPKKA